MQSHTTVVFGVADRELLITKLDNSHIWPVGYKYTYVKHVNILIQHSQLSFGPSFILAE